MDGTIVTVRPRALASGAAVCCVRLNSVANMAVSFASFSIAASDSARARPAADRSGSAAIVGLLRRRRVGALGVADEEDGVLRTAGAAA